MEKNEELRFFEYFCRQILIVNSNYSEDLSFTQGDYHTMYVGMIEKVLVRDDEYLK